MRADLSLIQDWITPGSRVLDLGCGDGELLSHLKACKQIFDCGVEIDNDRINTCLARGVNVIQQNIDKGLANFGTNSFDTVVLTQTLQAVHHPDLLVEEMLRVGKRCIISFPNFGYWRYRFYLMFKGRMPMSPHLPDTWYDTDNIHFCTVNDFGDFCRDRNISVLDRNVLDVNFRSSSQINLSPNFLGINATFHISR
jgi:methionine biosynthesis protein MetW